MAYTNRDGNWPPCPKRPGKKGWAQGHNFSEEKTLSRESSGKFLKELTCSLCGLKVTTVGFDA